MNKLDTTWLVKQIARVVDAPTSEHTVLTSDVNEEDIKGYIEELREHYSFKDSVHQSSLMVQQLD